MPQRSHAEQRVEAPESKEGAVLKEAPELEQDAELDEADLQDAAELTDADLPDTAERTDADLPEAAELTDADTDDAEAAGPDTAELTDADKADVDTGDEAADAAETPDEPADAKTAAAASTPSAAKPAPRKAPSRKSTARKPARKSTAKRAPAKPRRQRELVLSVRGLTKQYDETVAAEAIDLDVRAGWFTGIVGPNGAGKTTTLSMITGLLRPDAGTVTVHGKDVWTDPDAAKRQMGVLPDRLRLFDRLTGNQLLYYAGVLRGLDAPTIRSRIADLAGVLGLDDALGRMVTDYSAGMTKKIALAAAMIHSPRLLVLDEPFESVDPVSANTVITMLERYVAAGGAVLMSSHSMELVQRVCSHVAVIVGGRLLAKGTVDQVRGGASLEERFVELAGGRRVLGDLEWLHTFSD